jgi:acetyl esterase/lipase
VLIFVHGGGWTGGSKDLLVSGADVYANIGRFYAGHGIGTAVINYRLQPEVTWREQVDDVAHAVAWVRSNIAGFGGDPGALFLSGHSAGAQLAAFTALASAPLERLAVDSADLCGVIPVSGAGFDLADEQTYRMGARRSYYERRFRAGDPGDGWLREASAITYVTPDAPPFLLLHGSREWKSLGHQNRLLHRALLSAGVASKLRVAKQTHETMVLALTSGGKLPALSILEFVRDAACEPRARTGGSPTIP